MAKQGREVPPPWEWTEASVWTERMLATLERGIKGGKWFSLIDKVWKMENLQRAAQKVAAGKSLRKPDGRRCRQYAEQSARRLPPLQRNIQSGHYWPQPAQRIWIPKLGSKEHRPLVHRFIERGTYCGASNASNFPQRCTTGAALISAIPLSMRTRNSSQEATRIPRKKVRAIFPKRVSTRLSHEP